MREAIKFNRLSVSPFLTQIEQYFDQLDLIPTFKLSTTSERPQDDPIVMGGRFGEAKQVGLVAL